jgi:splicing factor 3B subunit 4
MYDPETGTPKGFGFVSYDSFEAADYAIECMNGSYLGGRQIVVQYAYKKVRRIVALMWTGPVDSTCFYI